AAQYNRADRNMGLFLVEVGNHKRRLIGADTPRLVVASQNLDHVLSRQQRESSVILDRTMRQFSRGGIAEFDVHVVANVLHRASAVDVLDLADEVDQRMFRSAPLGKRKLTSRNL